MALDLPGLIRRIEGQRFRYVSLGRLIELKRAAGRTKDLNILAELEALADEVDDDE